MKYDLVQVYFRKCAAHPPFNRAESPGESAWVRRHKAEAMAAAGVVEIVEPKKTTDAPTPAPEVVENVEPETESPNLTTPEGVAAYFGDDVEAMKAHCDEAGIKYGSRATRPEYFYNKIAKANK